MVTSGRWPRWDRSNPENKTIRVRRSAERLNRVMCFSTGQPVADSFGGASGAVEVHPLDYAAREVFEAVQSFVEVGRVPEQQIGKENATWCVPAEIKLDPWLIAEIVEVAALYHLSVALHNRIAGGARQLVNGHGFPLLA